MKRYRLEKWCVRRKCASKHNGTSNPNVDCQIVKCQTYSDQTPDECRLLCTETLSVPDTLSTDATPARVRNNRRRGGGSSGTSSPGGAGRPPLRNNIPASNTLPTVNNRNPSAGDESKTHIRQANEERNKLLSAVAADNSTARLPSSRQRAPQPTVATGIQSPPPGVATVAAGVPTAEKRPQPPLPRLPPEIAAPPGDDEEDDSAGKASGNGNDDDD